jgi:hypothetical protein
LLPILIHSGTGGIDLLQALRNKFPKIKIIICTGLPSLHEDFEQYSDTILFKPFKFEEFLKVINSPLNN